MKSFTEYSLLVFVLYVCASFGIACPPPQCWPPCDSCHQCVNGICEPKPNTCDSCSNYTSGCLKIPGTYCIGSELQKGSISQPSNNASVASSSSITLSASGGSDYDCYYYTGSCGHICSTRQNDPITVSWSAVWKSSGLPAGTFASGTTGTSVQWLSPGAGEVNITATWSNQPGKVVESKSQTITVKIVQIEKLQYYSDSGLADIAGPLYVYKGESLTFKAIPLPNDASWPSGKPEWGGAASGTGGEVTVTFNSISSPPDGYKTVTAECGNEVSADVYVLAQDGSNDPDPNYLENGTKRESDAPDTDPVSITGKFNYTARDMVIKGRAMDVVIERYYRSDTPQGVGDQGFGYGWDMCYNMKVQPLSDPAQLLVFDGTNNPLIYQRVAGSNPEKYLPPAGRYDYIVKNGNGTYTLVEKNGTHYHFNSDKNISSIQDRNGNSISFGYNGNGRLAGITDDLGRTITLAYYEATGLLHTITDFADRTWTYSYDSNRNLTGVTTPATDDYPQGLTTTYGYDWHLLETITDPNGQTWLSNTYTDCKVTSQVYGTGTTYLAFYPSENRTVTTTRNGHIIESIYNSAGLVTKETVYTKGLRTGEPASYITRHEYDSNMELVKTIYPGGNYVTFDYDTLGNLTCIAREPNNGDANIATQFTYEPVFSQVESITDPRGYQTTFDYDVDGNLETITYPPVQTPAGSANPVVTFTYNAYGQVETITDPNNLLTLFEYYPGTASTGKGQLWKVRVDPYDVNKTTVYEYDTRNNVTKITTDRGAEYSFAYNALDQRISATNPDDVTAVFKYNPNKMLEEIRRPIADANQITTYAYDLLDKVRMITDPLGNVTEYGFDAQHIVSDIMDAEFNSTYYDYDERDMLWKVTDANDGVTEYSYTLNGSLATVKDAEGKVTEYFYDGFDRLIEVRYADGSTEKYAYDKNSNLTSFTNRAGETIEYKYDALNRVTSKMMLGAELVTNGGFETDSDWNQSWATISDGTVNFLSYGSVSQSGIGIVSGRRYYTSFEITEYVSGVCQISVGNSSGSECYGVGIYSQEIGATIQDHVSIGASGNSNLKVDNVSVREIISETQYQYDIAGRLVDVKTETLPNVKGYWKLDENAANTMVMDSSGMGNHGQASQNTENLHTAGHSGGGFEFDGTNNTSVVIPAHPPINQYYKTAFSVSAWIYPHRVWNSDCVLGKYPTGYRMTFAGSSRLRVDVPHTDSTAHAASYGGSIVANQWQHVAFVYNANGDKTIQIYINGIENTYIYDAGVGDLSDDTASSLYIGKYNPFDGVIDEVAFFDTALSAAEIQAIYASSVQDVLGNYQSNQYDRFGRVKQTAVSNNKTIKYEYDNLDRRTKLTYPDETYVRYYYDAMSRVTDINDLSGNTIVHYDYDELSRVTQTSYYNNGSFVGSMTYDFEDKVPANDDNLGNRIAAIDYGCNPSHRIAYTYDNVGNARTTTISGGSGQTNYGWTYGYDNLYQVTWADQGTATNRQVNFGYNSVFGRTSWQDTLGSVNLSYSDNDVYQYTAVGATVPTYDARGNITSGYGGGLTLGYDAENRLVSAGAVRYTYDPVGRRVSRTNNGGTTYVWDGAQIIAEYDVAGGSLTKKYIYGPGIDRPVAMINVDAYGAETWYYYYADALGSVRLMTNASGAVVESYTYDVYGQPYVMTAAGTDGNWLTEDVSTQNSSGIGNPYMFTGRRWDAETGLYYYRMRDYSPQLGRFCQTDPLGYIDTMNLYQYCGNNPVNWIDPYGLFTALGAANLAMQIENGMIEGVTSRYRNSVKFCSGQTGTSDDVRAIKRDFTKLWLNSQTARDLMDGLMAVGAKMTIVFDRFAPQAFLHHLNQITHKPYSGYMGNGKLDWQHRPPEIGLGHELVHAFYYYAGAEMWNNEDAAVGLRDYSNAPFSENSIRRDYIRSGNYPGLVTRPTYTPIRGR